ncbi:hypothetical protein [Pseudoalteromonas umbrosa]|uniref:hypothetical protein n=1 Tax=Pseudoalteromonas umbrosa TaxID=3048489 RepID=UPI0024C28D01|nr:hypothetical protein [Pseudoalteromonas sp. B95]MDK1290066.1 hypothetical protein [Pseudoalteromonas sp. B95]
MSLNHIKRYLAGKNGRTTAARYAKTVFSSDVALIGVNDQNVIAVHWLMHNATPIKEYANESYLRSRDTLSTGHHRVKHATFDSKIMRYCLEYNPVKNAHSMIDEHTHNIKAWYLIGLDFNVPAELDEIGLSQGGTGTFGLGESAAVLNEAVLASQGRFWLRWDCSNVTVNSNTVISFGFVNETGASHLVYRESKQLDRVSGTFSFKIDDDKRALLKPNNRFIIDLDWFNLGMPSDNPVGEAVNQLSARFNEVAAYTAKILHGVEHIDLGPMPQLPVMKSTVLDLMAQGNWYDSFNLYDDTGRHPPLDINEGLYFKGGAAKASHFVYGGSDKTFSWPASNTEGVKVTIKLLGMHSGTQVSPPYEFNLRLVPADEDWRIARPIMEYNDDRAGNHCISTDTGSHYIAACFNISERNKPDGKTASAIPTHKAQKYELYYMPDGRVMVYVEGTYMTTLLCNPVSLAPNRAFRFDLFSYYSVFDMHELKVERFDVPTEYEHDLTPHLVAVNAFNSRNKLVDTTERLNSGVDSYAHGAWIQNINEYVDFTLTQDAKVSFKGHIHYNYTVGKLTKLDGDQPFELELPQLNSSEYQVIHENLPKGRYRLQATTNTHICVTGWRAEAPVVPPPEAPVPEAPAQ